MSIGAAAPGAASGFRPNIRRIVITLDANKKPQIAEVDKTIILKPANNEEVIWESSVPFLINFKGNSPFYEKQFSDKYAQSGLVRRDVLGSPNVFYEYSIIVNGEILDPRFGVDP
jgi:hypothetical protein